jgi:hypothetical protein
VILILGLGIGANTAIFSVVNGVLLRDLPFPEPDRLVKVQTRSRGTLDDNSSEANVLDYREQIESFESVGAYAYARVHFEDKNGARRILVARTTHELLPLMGAAPLLGRTFVRAEDQPGARPVVALSYGLWQSGFGGRHDIIGESIQVQGMMVTVVGIMPPSFDFPDSEVEAWVPLQIDPNSTYSWANH